MGSTARTGTALGRDSYPARRAGIPAAARLVAWSWCAIAVAVIAWSAARDGAGSPFGWLVLAAVAVAVQHRDVVVVQRESAFDAGMAVAVASVLLLGSHLAAPMAVGLIAGLLFVPQLRAHSWTRLACNGGNFALSTFAAWCAARALPFDARGALRTFVTAAVAGVAYWIANDGLGLALCAVRDRGISVGAARRILVEDARLLPLALVGGLAAQARMSLGWWACVLVLACAPVLVEVAVVGRRRVHGPARHELPEPGVLVAVAAAAIASDLDAHPAPATVDGVLATAEALIEGRGS